MSKNSEAVKDYRKRIKLALVEASGNKCGLCNNIFPPYVYEFHHINPKEKDFGISSKGITNSKDKVAKEALKCIMVCANCHRFIEYDNNKYLLTSNFNKEKFYEILNELNGTAERIRKKECEQAKKALIKAKEPLRPNREELKFLIRNYPFLQIGIKYGVTDNAIRKWCIKNNLPNSKRKINQLSDEDWKNI